MAAAYALDNARLPGGAINRDYYITHHLQSSQGSGRHEVVGRDQDKALCSVNVDATIKTQNDTQPSRKFAQFRPLLRLHPFLNRKEP